MRRILNKTISSFDNALVTVSSFFFVVIALLATVNALMRSAGLGGFVWSDEVCVILTLLLVFLTQPLLEYLDKQLSVDVLDVVLKTETAKKAGVVIRGIILIAVICFISYFCWETVLRTMRLNFLTTVLRFPRYILYGCMFVSFILTIINWLIKLFSVFSGNGKAEAGTEAETETEAGNGGESAICGKEAE